MESSYSSPHYMNSTSSSHAKKENSPGESEHEDTVSVSSSTVRSAVNGQYAPRNKSGIACRTNNKKTLKSLGNTKSFGRRAKSRILQPIEMSDNTAASCQESLVDASEASTHYLKSTSCSEDKKMNSQSSSDGSSSTFLGSKSRRRFKTMSRTSSIRNVRILIMKTSFKPRRPLLDHSISEDVAVDRATYSSTLKDSKFPQPIEVPIEETISGKNSGMKVCRYHHCSLHGHCREDHGSVSPPKPFLHKKRQPSIKSKNEIVKSDRCSCETKDYTDNMKNHQKSQMVSITKSSVQEGEIGKRRDLYLPFSDEQNSEAYGEGYGGIQDFDFLEIAFGETSFPERSYEENLIIMSKYSPQYQQIGYCLKCSDKDTERSLSTPRSYDHATYSSLDKDNTFEIPLNRDAVVLDTHPLAHMENSGELKIHDEEHASFVTDECENGTSSKDSPETPVIFDEVTKDRSGFSSLSDSQTLSDNNSEVEGELRTVSSITGDSITSVVQIPESGKDASSSEGNKLQFSRPRHMSMWHLIHQHMASELATEAASKPLPSSEDQDIVDNKGSFLAKENLVASQDFSDSNTGAENDSDTQEIEIPLNRDAVVLDTHPLAHMENSGELKIHDEEHASFVTDECENRTSSKDSPETPVIFDEVTKDRSGFSSLSDSQTLSDNNSEVEGELRTASSITGDSITSVVQIPESGKDASSSEGNKLQFSKPRHMSMWHLIHQHMASELATEAASKPLPSSEDQDIVDNKSSFLAKENLVASEDFSDSNTGAENDSDTQEIEIRKLFAIKLVREAIEKILLPEVQDDLSVTSENISPKEYPEKKQNEDCDEESYGDTDADKGKGCVPSTPEEMSPIVEDSFSVKMVKTGKSTISKSDKKAPKHWSNLKKWILLQRFIRELEKVRKFKPKKPLQLSFSPDAEAEKVNLRPLALDEKKRGEEWMLDYALRQAVNQLAPTQKRKVSLLVKVFETVVPPQEDNQIQHRRGKNGVPVEGKVTPLGNDKVSALVSARQERSATLIKKYSDLLTSNQNVSKSECGDSDPSVATKSLVIDDMGMSIITEKVIQAEPDVKIPQEEKTSEHKDTNGAVDDQVDRKDHIKMWHMIYQHVVSGIAQKMGSQLLDGSDDEDVKSPGRIKENHVSNNPGIGFTKSDALKLVKEAVEEILLPDTQDNATDSLSVSTEREISEENISEVGEQEKSKPKNWKKLKKLLLLKKSIKALEKARKLAQTHELLTQEPNLEPERVDLKRRTMDEKRKAEQWMLDYAVQHIVTKLNPARKRRVSMLVEAFEAVVPFPEI